MSIFVIVLQTNPNSENLPGIIARTYKESHIQLGDNVWLIADTVTSKEVSDKLGITDGKNGAAVVMEINSYYGRANNNIWAWIKNKWESKLG